MSPVAIELHFIVLDRFLHCSNLVRQNAWENEHGRGWLDNANRPIGNPMSITFGTRAVYSLNDMKWIRCVRLDDRRRGRQGGHRIIA